MPLAIAPTEKILTITKSFRWIVKQKKHLEKFGLTINTKLEGGLPMFRKYNSDCKKCTFWHLTLNIATRINLLRRKVRLKTMFKKIR